MNKIIKYGWWLLIVIPFVFVLGVYTNNNYKNGKAEIFGNQINSACSKENVDWDIAVGALSQHFSNLAKENPDVDFGPAEIERHFAENCEEDLKIYEKYLASYDWVESFFNNRIKELVGVEKYEDIIKWYTQPKEFSGCDDYLFGTVNKRADDIYSIRRLIEEKKYKELITLSDKYFKDSEVWYCDSLFWTQRTQAFYNLGNCKEALKEAVHAFVVSPEDNGNDEPEKERYFSILGSDICKNNL